VRNPWTQEAGRRSCGSSSQETRRWRKMDSNHRYRIKKLLFGCPRSVPQFAFRNKNRLFRAGTDGSNPSPSSAESCANPTPSVRGPNTPAARRTKGRGRGIVPKRRNIRDKESAALSRTSRADRSRQVGFLRQANDRRFECEYRMGPLRAS
jgi:hypothetical protein